MAPIYLLICTLFVQLVFARPHKGSAWAWFWYFLEDFSWRSHAWFLNHAASALHGPRRTAKFVAGQHWPLSDAASRNLFYFPTNKPSRAWRKRRQSKCKSDQRGHQEPTWADSICRLEEEWLREYFEIQEWCPRLDHKWSTVLIGINLYFRSYSIIYHLVFEHIDDFAFFRVQLSFVENPWHVRRRPRLPDVALHRLRLWFWKLIEHCHQQQAEFQALVKFDDLSPWPKREERWRQWPKQSHNGAGWRWLFGTNVAKSCSGWTFDRRGTCFQTQPHPTERYHPREHVEYEQQHVLFPTIQPKFALLSYDTVNYARVHWRYLPAMLETA